MKFFQLILRKLKYHIPYLNPNKRRVKKYIKRGLVVGKNFKLLKGARLDYSHVWLIEIGDNVIMGPHAIVLVHDGTTKQALNYTRLGKVKIGNRVEIGIGAIILPGVTIGDDVVIGAKSVVARDVPDRSVVAGNPARVICSFDELMDSRREEMKKVPCFGQEYTIDKNITAEMKDEMNKRMKDRIGYVV